MAKQSITVQLDQETIDGLALLGNPVEVLAELAFSAAERAQRPSDSQREHTDSSLRMERDTVDLATAIKSEPDTSSTSESARALLAPDSSLSDWGAGDDELVARRAYLAAFIALEREATDEDLGRERAHADTLIVDQREANEQMVRATLRAQELTDLAEVAKLSAEESEQALVRVAEFRESFIGILGHDLRNPVAAIVLAAALLLRRGHLNERDAEVTSRIIRSSQRVSRMITQLLDLTHARLGGGLPIEPKPADLRDILRNVLEEFEASIELEVVGDMTGNWDVDRLAQALSNLAGNAIEYATAGTAVSVQAQGEDADVIVKIQNQGAPIPDDVLPHIFEPFRRARQREKSASGNLGLGLYIAKQIVLSHGGTLDAESAHGVTTFIMRLPRLSPARG